MNDDELLKIVKRLNRCEKAKDIVKEKGICITVGALHKRLKKGGYTFDKKLGLWNPTNDEEMQKARKVLKEQDYIDEIEELYSKRYFVTEVWDEYRGEEVINIAHNLVDETRKRAETMGIEYDSFIELILLRYLNENFPRKSYNKYYKLISYFDTEEMSFEEIESNIKKYETEPEYKKELDEIIKELDQEYMEEYGEEFGEDMKDIINAEYEYKKKWFERERQQERKAARKI